MSLTSGGRANVEAIGEMFNVFNTINPERLPRARGDSDDWGGRIRSCSNRPATRATFVGPNSVSEKSGFGSRSDETRTGRKGGRETLRPFFFHGSSLFLPPILPILPPALRSRDDFELLDVMHEVAGHLMDQPVDGERAVSGCENGVARSAADNAANNARFIALIRASASSGIAAARSPILSPSTRPDRTACAV